MRRSYAVWRAFWSDRRAAVAAVFLLVEIALVLFLPLFLGQDPNLTDRSAGFWAAPSAQHWLGTDDVGRDLFARLLYGGRTSLLVGFVSAALGVAGMSCLWSILELKEQEKRVARGWFPKKERKKST